MTAVDMSDQAAAQDDASVGLGGRLITWRHHLHGVNSELEAPNARCAGDARNSPVPMRRDAMTLSVIEITMQLLG